MPRQLLEQNLDTPILSLQTSLPQFIAHQIGLAAVAVTGSGVTTNDSGGSNNLPLQDVVEAPFDETLVRRHMGTLLP